MHDLGRHSCRGCGRRCGCPSTIAHLDDTVAALNIHLDNDTMTTLDTIFPGYRTAPEDYAW